MRQIAVFIVLVGLGTYGVARASHASGEGKGAKGRRQACIDADKTMPNGDPGQCIADILKVINQNKGKKISELLPLLFPDRRPVVGANYSTSLQGSRHRDNPRLYFRIPCGYLTANLLGDSFEISIKRQKADPNVQPPGAKGPGRFSIGAGTGVFNAVTEGEMLLDLKPFPRATDSADMTAAEIFNRYNEEYPVDGMDRQVRVGDKRVRMETMSCTGCHVDTEGYKTPDGKQVDGTGAALGVRKVTVGKEEIYAIVSPQDRKLNENPGGVQYCVPSDLRFVYDCSCARKKKKRNDPRCQKMRDWDKDSYEAWTDSQRTEACARLKAVLRMRPRQNCNYDPLHSPDEVKMCYADTLNKEE